MKLRPKNSKTYATAIDFEERDFVRKIRQLMGSGTKVTLTIHRVSEDDPCVNKGEAEHSLIIEC